MITILDHPPACSSGSRSTPTKMIHLHRSSGLKIPSKPSNSTLAGRTAPLSFLAPPCQSPAASSEFELTTYYPAALPEAYYRWTSCSHFPHFMRALLGSYQPEVPGHTWRLALREEEVPWEAITVEWIPCKHIAWWSVGGRSQPNRGSVSFGCGGWRTTKITIKVEFYGPSVWAVSEATMRALRKALQQALEMLHADAMHGAMLAPVGASL
jgi:hypothetical protein